MFYRLFLAIIMWVIAIPIYSQQSFHDFKALNIKGDSVSMSEFKGKKLLVVNTASQCGYTYQYGELQSLYQQYGGDNFEIIGFPSNDFGNQEPGADSTIWEFCQENYGVTFTMMSKIKVTSLIIHPIYKWLTTKTLNGVKDSKVTWNFQKYLIDENGKLVDVVSTSVSPLSPTITNWLKSTNIDDEIAEEIISIIKQSDSELILNLRNDIANTEYISIYDYLGNKHISIDKHNFGSNEIRLDISALPNGVYFINSNIGGKKATIKFIK